MELGLTREQKLASLNAAKSGIQGEVFNMLLRLGIDPDTYDPNAGLDTIDPVFTGERNRINQLILSLAMIEDKIQAIL